MLHSVPLYRDLGKGLGNHFIASLRSALSRFGKGGDRSIASLRSALSRFGRGGDCSIASLRSALSRFGEGVGESLKPSPGNQVQLYPIWKQCAGTPYGNHQHRKKKLPLLLTLFAIHCLTKASTFVPQCELLRNNVPVPPYPILLLTMHPIKIK